jgi:hypothetical protein
VSHERYDEALHLIGIHSYKASLEEIKEAYQNMLDMIQTAKTDEINRVLGSSEEVIKE